MRSGLSGNRLTVLVTVCVAVAWLVTVTLVVFVICPGAEVIKHEHADESDEMPKPTEILAWRFLTGSSLGHEAS